MFLALAFGLFLGAPLVLLAGSLARTAMAISRGTAVQPLNVVPAAPVARTEREPRRVRPSVSRLRRSRRTRPAVAGGTRRDYFGDTAVAGRPAVTATSAVSRPIGLASAAGADVLAFRGRDAATPFFRADEQRRSVLTSA